MILSPAMVHFGVVFLLASFAFLVCRKARWQELGHLLWLFVFLKLLVPPVLEVPIFPAQLPELGIHPVGASMEIPAQVREAPLAVDLASEAEPTKVMNFTGDHEAGLSLWSILSWIWAAGTALSGTLLVISIFRFRRILHRSDPPSESLQSELEMLAAEMGLRKVPQLRIVPAVISPALWPFGRTIFLVPRLLYQELNPQQRRAILAHELAHFARRDHWLRFIELAALCIYWWAPPVWWFRRELRFAEESCCDARALKFMPGNSSAYAEALVETAAILARNRSSRLPQFATGANALKPLARRITAIMKNETVRPLSHPLRLILLLPVLSILPLLPAPAQSKTVSPPANTPATSFQPAVQEPVLETFLQEEQEPTMTREERVTLRLGMELIQQADLHQALEFLRQSQGARASAKFDFLVGNLLYQQRHLKDAAKAYESAVTKHPAFVRAWKNLAHVHLTTGDYEAAVAALHRAVDLSAGDGTTYGLLGLALSQLGDLAAAETAFWNAHLHDPGNQDWKLSLLQCLSSAGRHQEVLALSRRFLKEQPEDFSPLSWQAKAALQVGDLEAGGRLLERWLQMEPRNGEALLLLGHQRYQTGRMEEAMALYQRATELEGFRSQARQRQGQILLNLSPQHGTLEWLKQAQKVNPDQAAQWWSEAIELKPPANTPFVEAFQLDSPPRPLHQPAPKLNAETRKKLPGTVQFQIEVNLQGQVQNPVALAATDSELVEPALEAVRLWLFEPGKCQGRPVSFRMQLTLAFPADQ